MNPKTIARKFVRHVRANGAKHIEVWSCGDLLNEGSQRERDIVEAMTCTCEVTVTIRGGYATDENGLRRRVFLGRALWICSNDEDALSDWRIGPWADLVFGDFYYLVPKEERS